MSITDAKTFLFLQTNGLPSFVVNCSLAVWVNAERSLRRGEKIVLNNLKDLAEPLHQYTLPPFI